MLPRRDRRQRADRQVGAPGHDVDLQRRPHEVELAVDPGRVVARAARALAHVGEVAGEGRVALQAVGVLVDVDDVGEARVGDRAVVALQEVLDEHLPVGLQRGTPSGGGRRGRRRRARRRPRSRASAPSVSASGRRVRRPRGRRRTAPTCRARAARRPSAARSSSSPPARRRAQRAVEPVRPRVVVALKRRAAPRARDDLGAAVAADVDQRAQHAVAIAHHHHAARRRRGR